MTASARRWFVPETVQTSAMDCGPAALKALLEGFGIRASYGRLREACQTDVDGTSIDALEEVARQAGLDVDQTMVPLDHLFLDEAKALPALIVVRLPNGVTHFVIVWRVHFFGGPFDQRGLVQVMDPGSGRRWVPLATFLDEIYQHATPVPAAAWREFAGSAEFCGPLTRRLKHLGVASPAALVAEAVADPSWRSLGVLDASTRLTTSLLRAGALLPGREAEAVLRSFSVDARAALDAGLVAEANPVPWRFWSVTPMTDTTEEGDEQVTLRGAVLLTVHGRAAPDAAASEATVSPEVLAALGEAEASPARALLAAARADDASSLVALAAVTLVAAAAMVAEPALLRAMLGFAPTLGRGPQRLWGAAAVLVFLAATCALEVPLQGALLRAGRHLESRLRIAFLEKIPKLGDRYFQSRPVFDMTERGHAVQQLRNLPALAGQFVRMVAALAVTAAGIAWVAPGATVPALVAVALAVAVPLLAQRPLAELDLRFRAHAGALGRSYLDALRGLSAVRTHGAERAMRREHESLLVEWARAARSLQRASVALEGAEQIAGVALTLALLVGPLAGSVQAGGVLLLAYWALSIPELGAAASQLARQYPDHRAVTLRLLEPLGAIEDEPAAHASVLATGAGPVALRFDGVVVRAAGHTLLDAIDLEIPAGAHVGIVGTSGAGKSTLVGLLLGWQSPSEGSVCVDDEPLRGARLAQLRQETAWVDPGVQLWNRSLLDNLRYGAPPEAAHAVDRAVRASGLRGVLQRLPEGLQTALGEGGALVSGGEGQRVRLARALLRPGVRLAVLDEPFRGLDRGNRRELLARARAHWKDATLLCVTHDVGETLTLPRVLVVEGGRIVEDGPPEELAARPDSRYRALLDAEHAVRVGRWSDPSWRRLRLERGSLRETPLEEP